MYLKPESTKDIVRQVCQSISNIPDNITIDIANFSDNTILCDRRRLCEVILNIMSNAFDAIIKKGPGFGGQVSINSYRMPDDVMVVIEISDNGTGIEHKKQKKIFDPFYSDKNMSHSWGLGLSYAHKILKQHGGHIRLKSTPGLGSVFYIFIPRMENER